MRTVNVHEAKANLSCLVEAIETGAESEVAIARNGRAVARPVAVARTPVDRRIGVARSQFTAPDTIDTLNEDIERLYT